MTSDTTWLASGVRTPFARVDGGLRRLDAIALSVPVAKAMAAQLPQGGRPDLVVWGTVAPNMGWSNIAREVVIDSGVDPSTPAFTTVLACSTSMVAVFEAAGMLGKDLDVALCGGVESMSRVQIGLKQGLSDLIRRVSQARTFGERVDRLFGEFHWSDFGLHVPSVANRATGKSIGEHCEEMAKQWKIARSDQDRVALQSHQRAVKGMASGFPVSAVLSTDQIVAVKPNPAFANYFTAASEVRNQHPKADAENEITNTGATGLEPATSAVTGQRSNQLSYVPRLFFNNLVIRHIESSVSQLSLLSLFSTISPLWTQFWVSVDTMWTPRWTPKPSPQRQARSSNSSRRVALPHRMHT